MAEEVEMTPVEAAEPPKVNPLNPAAPAKTMKLTSPMARPGLKLPPKPAMAAGLKLPTRPGATMAARPVLRKPGVAGAAAPLPKPISASPLPKPVTPAAPAEPAAPQAEKPMEALKSVTQKLKGITQQIPQQAILHKTGIIADSAATDAQKEAAKHKTARIALSDAMGVAPVKDEHAPMKTIRIKRPGNLPSTPASPVTPAAAAPAAAPAETPAAASVTQRKTLKITRPGPGGVRPKFGRPAAAASPAAEASPAGEVADIPDIPAVVPPTPAAPARTSVATIIATIMQLAACGAIGALAWFLYECTEKPYFN